MTASTQPRRKKMAPSDRQKLQGIWLYVSGQRKAELLIAGRRFTVKFRNGDLYMGTFTLSPARKPRHIDMTIEEGPSHHRGRVSRGIYQFHGEALHWSPGEPGKERPAAFPTLQDREQLYLVFRREHA
jgi:uncharacterized protein (TIGR03067 family)